MPDTQVVIVGAGFGGLAAARELLRDGWRDVTILEASGGLGGTWRHNDYPGAACDVPSHMYSYSFAKRKDWSRLCSPQSEILAYLEEVADREGLTGLVVPNTRVEHAGWSAEHGWTVRAEDGRTWRAQALVVATGQLSRPAIPSIEGAERFAGRTFHSAAWDHGYDLTGKRVAVIGTGASAVQFVPEVAKQAGHLTVFQRTGNWFMPRRNPPYPRWFRRMLKVPGLQAARRVGIRIYLEFLTAMIRNPGTVGRIGRLRSTLFMRWQLRDPEVRRKVWPDYTWGCKRILFSSHWLPALQRPNVTLETRPVARIEEDAVVCEDGTRHAADCVIWGTGFRATEFMFPMEVDGAGGRSLRDAWAEGPHAHLGIAIPGFPSLFVMYGPNTNTSGGSIIVYLEAQAAYIRQALAYARARGAPHALTVRPEVEAASDREVQGGFDGTAWTSCDSWYRDDTGRIVTNWPWYMRDYEKRTAAFAPGEYELLATA